MAFMQTGGKDIVVFECLTSYLKICKRLLLLNSIIFLLIKIPKRLFSTNIFIFNMLLKFRDVRKSLLALILIQISIFDAENIADDLVSYFDGANLILFV